LSRLYLGRFSDVHIGGPSSNQATSLESQMIHPTQLLPGRTLIPRFQNQRSLATCSIIPPSPMQIQPIFFGKFLIAVRGKQFIKTIYRLGLPREIQDGNAICLPLIDQ
jgi:hypothetical protein